MSHKIRTDAGKLSASEVRLSTTAIGPKIPRPDPSNVESEIYSTQVYGRFFERVHYSSDALEYTRNGDDPGLVLVFNQENFEDMNAREGSQRDVQEIITCFGRLGFNIRPEHIFQDLSRNELFAEVDEVLRSDLSQINAVLVFILSHGSNCNTIYTSSATFQLEDLLLKFHNCAILKGKPKMFVIQACKGGDSTDFSRKDAEELLVPLSTFEKTYPDMFILFSTMEGKCSFRHVENGTWLIQEVCKNFTAYGRRDDVSTVSSRVIKCICTNYYNLKSGSKDVEKQIPVVVSTLSKKFYLNTNKDRHFALRSTEIIETISNEIRRISETMGQIFHGYP